MLFFLNSFTLLSRLSLSNTVSNIACKIDEEELHSVFVPMHISAIHRMKKDLVMSAKHGLCGYKSFSCLKLFFFTLFSASLIRCSHKGKLDRQTDGHLRNHLTYKPIGGCAQSGSGVGRYSSRVCTVGSPGFGGNALTPGQIDDGGVADDH